MASTTLNQQTGPKLDRVQTPDEILEDRDKKRIAEFEAEIQKKLTKAASYFAGRITQTLGLRY
jgi:hypothetical protein